MFKYNNTHIFTKYLKQFLSSFNLPTCKIYTKEFAKYKATHGVEDPRVLKSFDTIKYQPDSNTKPSIRMASRTSYLKNDEVCYYFWNYSQDSQKLSHNKTYWKQSSIFYDSDNKLAYGLARRLNSPGSEYDTATHEYLGDYLRFMRDYYNINLMSLYNCFNNKIYNNVVFDNSSVNNSKDEKLKTKVIIFDSNDPKYNIYAFPVKLFSNYTIAVDCEQGVEMFCGLYKTSLYNSDKAENLILKTHHRESKTIFKQPFLYDKLDQKNWKLDLDDKLSGDSALFNNSSITSYDIMNHEKDLKLFIKIPVNCKSSIVVLEGDFRHFNDCKFAPQTVTTVRAGKNKNEIDSHKVTKFVYEQNSTIINFDKSINLNEVDIPLIGKLQLLALNTGESYPFADRLVEYLSNSVITPIDKVSDNIKRVQKVMGANHHYFKTMGVWENKIQKITYDYLMNSGQIKAIPENELCDVAMYDSQHKSQHKKYTSNQIIYREISHGGTESTNSESATEEDMRKNNYKHRVNLVLSSKKSLNGSSYRLVDFRQGYYNKLGHVSKSSLFDVLGYIDKDAEKWYSNWKLKYGAGQVTPSDNEATTGDNIQNVDIYDNLYDKL